VSAVSLALDGWAAAYRLGRRAPRWRMWCERSHPGGGRTSDVHDMSEVSHHVDLRPASSPGWSSAGTEGCGSRSLGGAEKLVHARRPQCPCKGPLFLSGWAGVWGVYPHRDREAAAIPLSRVRREAHAPRPTDVSSALLVGVLPVGGGRPRSSCEPSSWTAFWSYRPLSAPSPAVEGSSKMGLASSGTPKRLKHPLRDRSSRGRSRRPERDQPARGARWASSTPWLSLLLGRLPHTWCQRILPSEYIHAGRAPPPPRPRARSRNCAPAPCARRAEPPRERATSRPRLDRGASARRLGRRKRESPRRSASLAYGAFRAASSPPIRAPGGARGVGDGPLRRRGTTAAARRAQERLDGPPLHPQRREGRRRRRRAPLRRCGTWVIASGHQVVSLDGKNSRRRARDEGSPHGPQPRSSGSTSPASRAQPRQAARASRRCLLAPAAAFLGRLEDEVASATSASALGVPARA